MEYNYLKTLPKDILIKLLTEVEDSCLKSRYEWFKNIMEENRLKICDGPNCTQILYEDTEEDFEWCETCNTVWCPKCVEAQKIIFRLCQCACEDCVTEPVRGYCNCGSIKICSNCEKCHFCQEDEGVLTNSEKNKIWKQMMDDGSLEKYHPYFFNQNSNLRSELFGSDPFDSNIRYVYASTHTEMPEWMDQLLSNKN